VEIAHSSCCTSLMDSWIFSLKNIEGGAALPPHASMQGSLHRNT
jgi:hypothetical protein